nr:hypothetical protein FA04_14750 [Ensifer adhaerens]
MNDNRCSCLCIPQGVSDDQTPLRSGGRLAGRCLWPIRPSLTSPLSEKWHERRFSEVRNSNIGPDCRHLGNLRLESHDSGRQRPHRRHTRYRDRC